LETQQRFVVDNTNCTRSERANFLPSARRLGFSVVGYYFRSTVAECLTRNSQRLGDDRVPDVAILAAAKRLERPALCEGFDQLFYVRLEGSGFAIEEWNDDL
jgi:predicted kinase